MTASVAHAREEITRRTVEGEFGHPPNIDIDLRDRAWMEIFEQQLSNRQPLNVEECGANDVANEDVKLNTFESKFASFLGKTLLAGKHALDAVKDFNERNQITVKTALSDFKQNIKALDDKFQFTANVKMFDENAGATKGVKKTVATINDWAKEIDRSLKISHEHPINKALIAHFKRKGRDNSVSWGIAESIERYEEDTKKKVSRGADIAALYDQETERELAKEVENRIEELLSARRRTEAKRGPKYTPADRSQTKDAAEGRQRARISKRPREPNPTSDPGNWTDEKAKRIAKDWCN